MASYSLPVGKLEPKLLERLIFNRLGVRDSRVLLAPKIGEDATVIDFGERALVIHSDPITGTVENLGWLAVNVCTNDIATRGVRPLWILTVLLLPEKTDMSQLKNITTQINRAAKHLGVAVVGGHSEVTSSVKHPVVITTAIGESLGKKYVRTSGAKVDDTIILTKGAAIEGTAILASELGEFLRTKLDTTTIKKAKNFIKKTSVVQEALAAVEAGGDGVHAMHDATEGGVAGGLQEIAWASNVGLIAYEDKIAILHETQLVCKALNIDPLRTISSGTLIIAAEAQAGKKVVSALRQRGIHASPIGRILEQKEGKCIIRKDGTKLDLSKPVREELWKPLQIG